MILLFPLSQALLRIRNQREDVEAHSLNRPSVEKARDELGVLGEKLRRLSNVMETEYTGIIAFKKEVRVPYFLSAPQEQNLYGLIFFSLRSFWVYIGDFGDASYRASDESSRAAEGGRVCVAAEPLAAIGLLPRAARAV